MWFGPVERVHCGGQMLIASAPGSPMGMPLRARGGKWREKEWKFGEVMGTVVIRRTRRVRWCF